MIRWNINVVKSRLIDCISAKLFYKLETLGEQDWKIAIRQSYRDEESVTDVQSRSNYNWRSERLQPPAPHYWGVHLAICLVKESQIFATPSIYWNYTDGRVPSNCERA